MSEKRAAKHRLARRPLSGVVKELAANDTVKRISILAGSSVALTGVIAAGVPTQPTALPANSLNASQLAQAALQKASSNPTVETASDDELLPSVQASVAEARRPAPPARTQQRTPEAPAAPRAEVNLPSADGSIVGLASAFAGTPYRWGGTTPAGFDCSGFVSYVYGLKGINLPHQSSAIANSGTRIPVSQAQPGDVLWRPGHVAIYVGNGMMIHASTPSTGVVYAPVSSMRFQSAVRF